MKLHIENSIVIETEGKKVTLGQGEYEFDSVNEFIRFVERLGEPTKQPLIKDEKIRKAVRTWAEAECITKAYLENDYTICRDDAADVSISFYAPVFKDVGGTSDYTIAELCGEGEE
jgi:hypothetical protein